MTESKPAKFRYPFKGPLEWHGILLQSLQLAKETECERIVWCDRNFASWPLGSSEILAALETWVAHKRELVLVASEFDTLTRQHPRLLAWRKKWDGVIQGRKVLIQFAKDTPSAIWTPHAAAWMTNPQTLTGVYGTEAELLAHTGLLVTEWADKRAVNGFASHTLGL